jgi:uncharacterized protein YpmB
MKQLVVLLLFLSLIWTGCTAQTSETTPAPAGPAAGSTCIPSDTDAKTYILRKGLLKTIARVEKVPTRFEESGPGYKLVLGRDYTDHDRAIWLCRDDQQQIQVINSVLLSDGLSQASVIERLRDEGLVDRIFLAPVDLPPFDPKQQVAWHVSLRGKPNQLLWIDFATGKLLLQNNRPD